MKRCGPRSPAPERKRETRGDAVREEMSGGRGLKRAHSEAVEPSGLGGAEVQKVLRRNNLGLARGLGRARRHQLRIRSGTGDAGIGHQYGEGGGRPQQTRPELLVNQRPSRISR